MYEGRVRVTTSCRDCDSIPKHKKAGVIEISDTGEKYQYMFNGIRILYDSYHPGWMNEIIKNLHGHHEPQEELCFYYVLQTLPQKATMVELGSSWSYYSIWFNKHIADPHNICIEPVQSNLDNGIANSKLNNCKSIDFKRGCIGEKFIDKIPFQSHTIPQYSIDKIYQEYSTFFDIIHSDIQGAETCMLTGAKNVLDNIGYFIISTHDNRHNTCCNFLKDNNFTILVQHSIGESFSADGLIVAVNNKHIERYEKNMNCKLVEFFDRNCNISRKGK